MPTKKKEVPWFVAMRSEALAGLLLTSRRDVRIQSKAETEDGVDFVVEVDPRRRRSTRYFIAQVRGTLDSRETWETALSHADGLDGQVISLPTCIVVVHVRDDQAFYRWLAEPSVGAAGAELRLSRGGSFRELDPKSLATIVEQVGAWYDALPKQLIAT